MYYWNLKQNVFVSIKVRNKGIALSKNNLFNIMKYLFHLCLYLCGVFLEARVYFYLKQCSQGFQGSKSPKIFEFNRDYSLVFAVTAFMSQ